MKFPMLIIILLLMSCPGAAPAQDSKFFRAKLGKPSELYRHRSGISVRVDYDDKGQACSINLSDPTPPRRFFGSIQRLVAVADELVPSSKRGGIVGKTSNIGNCIDVRYEDYERAFVEMDANACYASDQSVRIFFKRSPCPKPPSVPGLIPAKERSNKRLQLTPQ